MTHSALVILSVNHANMTRYEAAWNMRCDRKRHRVSEDDLIVSIRFIEGLKSEDVSYSFEEPGYVCIGWNEPSPDGGFRHSDFRIGID